jgi:hypothetical protein
MAAFARITFLSFAIVWSLVAPGFGMEPSGANNFYIKNGNIFSSVDKITNSGDVADFDVSPDKTTIVFIRKAENASRSGIYLLDLRTKLISLLIEEKTSKDPEKDLTGLALPHFSVDGRSVYFSADAWATSGAIHVIDLNNKQTRFVSSGNGIDIVRTGPYVGNIVTERHVYEKSLKGSYNSFFLIDQYGNVIAELGNDEEQKKTFLSSGKLSIAGNVPTQAPTSASADAMWYVIAVKLGQCVRVSDAFQVNTPDDVAAMFEKEGQPLEYARKDEMIVRLRNRAKSASDPGMAFVRGKQNCEWAMMMVRAQTQR